MQIHGQFIKLDDGNTLHVVTSGDVSLSPLLMLHCWTGNWTQWERTMQQLDGKFRFIVPDQLGFGSSDKPAGQHYQIDVQAKRARQILTYFGYDSATVIGHSMGGQIGLTLAGMFPDAVDKLIVCAPAVTGKTHPLTEKLTKLLAVVRMGFPQPYELLVFLGKVIKPVGLQTMRVFFADPEKFATDAEYWSNQTVADGQLLSSAWAEQAIAQWDVTPLLPNITAPTLAIWGELDYTIPISECDVLTQHIPTFEAVRIADIGHFPMIEGWDIYLQSVNEFLS